MAISDFNFQQPYKEMSKSDRTTLEALQAAHYLDYTGPTPVIPRNGGPYQAIEQAAPKMSPEATAILAHMIIEDRGTVIFKEGEQLAMPRNYQDKLTTANLRAYLHVPFDASKAVEFKALEHRVFQDALNDFFNADRNQKSKLES